ncbi:MAG: aminopeptidase P family protein [Ruminococcaceae bacterium]|nr:aminopeptidase P family protein [Oscillospiraceae bacterium]
MPRAPLRRPAGISARWRNKCGYRGSAPSPQKLFKNNPSLIPKNEKENTTMSHLKKLQAAMKAAGAEAIVVSSEVNQRYLSGLNYTDGFVVILPEKAFLLADFRYIEDARTTVDASEFEIVMPDRSMLAYVAAILKDHAVGTVLFEEATLSYALLERFKKAFEGVELQSGGSAMIDKLRLYKDESEIEKMTRAQKLTDDAFSHILNFITPDRTEVEVALELEFFMRAHGSEGIAFDTIAVSGTQSSRPHGVPRPVKLERGFFTMDFGARVDGYCADMTRTVVIGKADEEIKRLYNTVLLAQTTAIDSLRVGLPCAEADKIARDIIDNAGYKGLFGHSLGHGVGLYIHEAPRFAASVPADELLKPGHVVTVEPGIYIEGKYGCRIEDMIAVLPDGTIHDFTKSPKELIELC